jgi:malate synthase
MGTLRQEATLSDLSQYRSRGSLTVDPQLVEFIESEVLPVTKVEAEQFWTGLSRIVDTLAPRNRDLLAQREIIQSSIDAWHRERADREFDEKAYVQFLTEIEYLVPRGPAFAIQTSRVDAEIATIAGPQLVVPASNARYAINAANARWGSLYDALYGTDAMGNLPPAGGYDQARGSEVVSWARQFLDDVVPLTGGSHSAAARYVVDAGHLVVEQADGARAELTDPAWFTGYTGDPGLPTSIMLTHHGLGIELVIDPGTPVGRLDPAGLADVLLESAVTTIVDFEDSVAAVDASDKVNVYRNWLGLMTGRLTQEVHKGDRTFTRRLTPNRLITAPDGSRLPVRSRALLLARNVGHLMTTSAVLDSGGAEVPEGLLDAMVTVTIALVDLQETGSDANSPAGSVYIVKPKMHGPAEVAFSTALFGLVEQVLQLPADTVKIGIMDEERRTTVNLAESIRAAKSRVAFINTGFLDRTGDEIHTSMEAGPMVRKSDMKSQAWIKAYEDWNVDVGLSCGLRGRAQIGKGMWAAPDLMADMLRDKRAQPQAGASCAWVPSPTAATLHATHYHRVDVAARQQEIVDGGTRAELADLLRIPVAADPAWSSADIQAEVENNTQGILGYVVRWVDQGIGCSKVPDIHGVALMEDRATCRISSQHLANWLRHAIITPEEVDAALRKTALIVDDQNANDEHYRPMGPAFDGEAFRAARDLIVRGIEQPAGYTEPILHAHRRAAKAANLEGSQ